MTDMTLLPADIAAIVDRAEAQRHLPHPPGRQDQVPGRSLLGLAQELAELESLDNGKPLAVARAAGETAPLLFTALFSNYWIFHDGSLAVMNPTASLAVLIYNFSGMPFDNQLELAWAASLVLVMIVLVVNIVSRIFGKPKY